MKWIGIKQAIMSDNKQMRFGVMMVLMLLAGIFGGMMGYFAGTGTMPFVKPPETIIPTAPQAVVTRAETIDFITSDATNLVEYGEGYNCVEYAFVLALRGRWQGLPAMVIRVDFEGQPLGHLLIAYNTTDGGVIYFDPATDTEVKPRVGGELAGKKITGLYILSADWMPYKVVEAEKNVEEAEISLNWSKDDKTGWTKLDLTKDDITPLVKGERYEFRVIHYSRAWGRAR